MEIRRATPDDAAVLTRVANAAKRHWGYPEAWIELWRPALTVTPAYLAAHPAFCAVEGGEAVGFYALVLGRPESELDHLWVEPSRIGRGVGSRLLRHACARAREAGAASLRIEADPNAEGFYLRGGATRIGEVPSRPAGRTLPLLRLAL